MNWTLERLGSELEAAGCTVYQRGANDLAICCPFCPENDPDTKGKCYVTPNHPKYGDLWHCFRCEQGGGFRKLFSKLGITVSGGTIDTGRLEEKILRAERNRAFKLQSLPKKLKPIELPEDYRRLEPALVSRSVLAGRAYGFLKNRGLGWDQIRDWQIGYCTMDHFENHLILPVFDSNRNIVSFQARRFLGTFDPKSKNPKSDQDEFGREDLLYGIHKVEPHDCLVLVEGPFDVHHLERCFKILDLPQFKPLGLFGHKLTQIQALTIQSKSPEAVWTMMDSDAVAETFKMAQKLSPLLGAPVYACALEKGDPDDLKPIQALKKLKNSPQVRHFPSLQLGGSRSLLSNSKRGFGEGR